MRQTVSEGYFWFTIHSDKDEFSKGEQIGCWAELEYIGDNDSITVYSNGNLIDMNMTGKDANYNSSFGFISAQKTITLQKGVPVRRTLADCLPNGSSAQPGQYEIDANCGLSLSPDGVVSYYDNVSAIITMTTAE